jgi:hypothetical protein
MTKQTILICDDDPGRVAAWKERLERLALPFQVRTLAGPDLGTAVGKLGERRGASRNSRKAAAIPQDHEFDRADILIIDYDLLDADPRSSMNGENVAYVARCYSSCGLIVGVNQYDRENAFDLSLRGHPESYADINLSADQLDNPGLWRSPWIGFRPWYWPLLPAALGAFKKRLAQLARHLDTKILDFLGFTAEASSILPRSTIEHLGSDKSPEDTTFRNFVERSVMGLRPKDKVPDAQMARIAAARVGKWLERLVLPGQDVLVDAPHLALRFPSLLRGDVTKPRTWNASASLATSKSLWSDKGGLREKIGQHRFRRQDWLSRPAWFWNELSRLEVIKEVRSPWSAERPDFVFCEDVSRFLPHDEAREFVADLASPFVRRSVVDPGSCSDRELASDLRRVNYKPKVRFSI